ncbi:hypothetical protein I4U23_003615, partial [Adineta vaga]
MDNENDDNNDTAILNISNAASSTTIDGPFTLCTISLYILRFSDSNNNWKIQAVFDNQLKYAFNEIATLIRPGIYDNGDIYIAYKQQLRKIDRYRLYISQSRNLAPTSHHEDNILHHLSLDPTEPNKFLFSSQFQKSFHVISAPGGDISFWENLCIFPYFMINMKCYDLFDSFLKQFSNAVQESRKGISQENLNIFFQLCRKYYSEIEQTVKEDLSALNILIRMVSVLPTNRENLTGENEAARLFTSIVFKKTLNDLHKIWPTILDSEWTSFREGLITLCSLSLIVYQDTEKQTTDCFNLLSMIPDEERRKEIATRLLTLLSYLGYSLRENKDASLYTLVGKDHLTLEHLELAATLETYISYLTQFLLAYQGDYNELQEKIGVQLDKLLQQKRFRMELTDILFLLNYMNSPTKEDNNDSNGGSNKTIKFVLETNRTLQNTFKNYLNEINHHISLDEFPLVRDIIFRSYNSYLLYDFDRQQYLSRMLARRNNQTVDYFIGWFKYFLCESNAEWIDYQKLTHQWTECFVHNEILLLQILQQIDMLIELWIKTVPNDRHRSEFFIAHMVTQCFRQDQLRPYSYNLKQTQNPQNPLSRLMNIDKQHKKQNALVKDLLILATSLIQITEDTVLSDTFYNPSRDNLIYAILFDESLNTLPIYKQTIFYVNAQWRRWNAQGVYANDARKWKGFTSEQRTIVRKIWAIVTKTAQGRHHIDAIFDATARELKDKLETNEKIVTCLNEYCQEGSDKTDYLTQIQNWQNHLEQAIVQSIQIPKEFQKIVPYAEKLNPYVNAQSWRAFLKQKTTIKAVRESIEKHREDTDIDLSEQQEPVSPDDIEVEFSNKTTAMVRNTCIGILQDAVTILEKFHCILQHICETRQDVPIRQIVHLFPDIHHAANDLELLKPLLDTAALPQLVSIVSFWKNRLHISHVCNGLKQLSERMSVVCDSTLFNHVCDITEDTPGGECALIYEQYQNQIEKQLPDTVLAFISHYSSSSDLFDFLHSLTADDIYNLQEAVNDWDETLINTKTIFDFAIVKTFIDRAYDTMKTKRQELENVPFQLNHIIDCFAELMKNDQFKDLLTCVESSSLAVSSIKRIHLELTDKEQSKRRQIADILQKSTISFIRKGRHETAFDVNVDLPRAQTTNNNNNNKKQHKVTFADLSELRDRARLLEYSSNINKKSEMQANSERDKEILHNFIRFATLTESTIEKLTRLYTAGHPSVSNFPFAQETFSCADGSYDDLQRNSDALTTLLKNWETKLCTMYQTHIGLTYFTGAQFWQIEDYIYRRSSLCDPGYHLLRYINIDPNSIEKPVNRPQNPEDRLENIGRLLSQEKQIPDSLEENQRVKKCSLIETTNDGILRAILSLFHITSTIPSVCHIFYCTQHTNWIQTRAFIYRCFYSQSCHQLIRPELLSQSIQDQFVRLLHALIEERPQHKFRMGIVTTTKATDLQMINGLQSMQMLNVLRDHELLNNDDLQTTIQRMTPQYQWITSKITGLGKSTVIRQHIQSTGKNYVKFSISGDYDVDLLAERLRSKYGQLQRAAIHLDIGATDNIAQLNEILYCLLLFRSFRFGHEAVGIPNDTAVYIELDASPHSALIEIPLFHHLQRTSYIDHVDWTALDVNIPEIQIVANYLQAITNKTIIKKNINPETFKILDLNTCSRLIQDHFLQKKNAEYITWTQLSIYINIFHRLFTGFSRCGYFLIEHVPHPQLRVDLIRTLLESSNQFTSISVENVRKQQRSVATNEPAAFSDAIVRWDKIQPFTMILTATDEPLFVYKRSSDVPQALVEYFKIYERAAKRKRASEENTMFPEYTKLTHAEFFIKLASLSRKYFNKSICLKCFRQYEFRQQQCLICSTKDALVRPKSIDHADVMIFQLWIAEELRKEYVLTPDNFVKMLLIYTRVQSRIPVLIMGETGCGKTALIQFLCQKILDDDLTVFRMHAGIGVEKILETVQGYIQQAKECQTKNKRLWIFFDEFNTTSNIGLLKEIICERTFLGNQLPENMVFLGACNPRRTKTKKMEINDDAHIGLRKNRYKEQERLWAGTNRRLLYTVVPIPETMLEYIWDYGHLDASTERVYIKAMLNTCHHLDPHSTLFKLIVDLLVESQNHFRDLEDTSSVSLRDIARFCRLYNWFLDSLNQRADKNGKDESVYPRRASFISLMLCYYFRLRSVKLQEIYKDKMQSIIGAQYPKIAKIPNYLTKYVLESEQKQLIDEKMELPAGTASNRALRDNIFVLFACIINRIPLFLCGKPGSSKSSAVQILISNLKGKNSKDPYFQVLPELVAVSFQGSQNCTSESIVKVFERAANYSRVKSRAELLPVIVFDEIGLAELSPHNPLKVLHAELEVENNQYGFVGISNWRLDASKMNRALYLSTPDPNVTDLQLTGTTISSSMQLQPGGRAIQLESIIMESLAQAYYDLYENLKETQPSHENYFGLRDYYSLIKGIVRSIMAMNNNTSKYKIIREQLKVNFDGVLDGSSLLWQQFCHYINQETLTNEFPCPAFDHLLNQTLNNRSGRYLMLIADSDSAIDYVERFININQQKRKVSVRTLVGSSFPGDLLSSNTYSEEYNYRVLMDVILYAETNITLIMRQMGHVYDNLYDLFNQNFAVSARKKYCRIALGPLYHPRCLVHDDFYCVVFIHKRDFDNCDPPFLNRFEKHLIDIQSLIHPRYLSIAHDLHTWLNTLLPKNVGKHFPLLQHLFVDYSQDQICNLAIETFEQLKIAADENEMTDEIQQMILEHCQSKLLRTSSFDLPLVLSLDPTREKQELMKQYYELHRSMSLSNLIEQSFQNQVNLPLPRIIYTYTQIFHSIEVLPKNFEEIKLSAFKTELELTNKIKRHYQALTDIRFLLIRVDYHAEREHILTLKHVLLNERVLTGDRDVWLIFHLQRNLLNQVTNDVLFSNWATQMIDDLNKPMFIPRNILDNRSYRDLVLQPEYMLSECMFDDLVDRCLAKFRYVVLHENDKRRINERRDAIYIQITESNVNHKPGELHLRSIIEENLMMLIQNDQLSDNTRFNDWRFDLLTNGKTIAGSRTFNDAFQATISTFHESYLLVLLAHLEKYHLIDAYHFLSSIFDKNIRDCLSKLWQKCFIQTFEKLDLTVMNRDMIEVQLIFDLKLPCATAEYENIRIIREKLQQLDEDNNENYNRINFTINQLKATSIYGEDFMGLVFTESEFFKLYFHDQIALHLTETNIYLSPELTFNIFNSNPTRSLEQNAGIFLAHYVELTEILRLFEITLELTNEDEICNMISKQLVKNPLDEIKSSMFYSLVITNEKFYQLPPKITKIEDKWEFRCQGDPMIETSLMNLIELILSTSIINKTKSIQQITTAYSLIAQNVRDLPLYLVNNLEKLRSFISLVRCLSTLLPAKALDIFKDVCKQGFDGEFDTCRAIHQFISGLRNMIRTEGSTVNENIVHRTLVKLEVEFLKDWLADNGDSYGDILILMNENDNDLWQYSAKIFTYVDRKLDLISTLKENHGKLPSNEDYEQFDHSLKVANNTTQKVDRLMVNRLHMQLMRDASGDQIEPQLREFYADFERNFRENQNIKKVNDLETISSLAWLKYYTQIYGFALNNDSREDVMHRMDELLTSIDTPFCSTLKLFVLKQILQISGMNLDLMRERYMNRNIIWIKPYIQRPRDQQTQDIRRNYILPTPLFECQQEFQRTSEIFNNIDKINDLKRIILECNASQKFSYALLIWFIQYYCRFLQPNVLVDDGFVQLIERDLSQELIRSFTPLGHRYLISLCSNFSNNSYFHLQPTMESIEIHKRLIALNIMAIFISLRSQKDITVLGNILFNNQRQMPNNYAQHLSTICLPGMTVSDPVITQMMDVRTQVQDRLNRGVIAAGGRFIFQCSMDCPWVFIFQDCGVPNDRNTCPLCKKPIGAERYNILVQRDPPQIQMPIDEGLRVINQHIDRYNQAARFGYHNIKTAVTSDTGEKPDHLNRPVSFRFIHLLTHGLLLFLHDVNYLTADDLKQRLKLSSTTHFRDHFEKDYTLLAQSSTDNQQCYIWIYKLLNHLVNEQFAKRGLINTNEQILQIEQLIEHKLLFAHINSIPNEIAEYKRAYAEFIQERDSAPTLDSFIDELFEDENQYPLSNFFNVTTFHTCNLLNEFMLKMQTLPYGEGAYPVTTFLFKRFDDYINIQYLYAIVVFINYLIEKFNYRIKRNDAAEKKILDYLTTGGDQRIIQQLYDDFLHAWYALKLKEVRYGCQTPKFELTLPKEKFAEQTSIATLLLNTSKDESSLLLAAVLRTIAELQNEIVNYFHNTVDHVVNTETKRKHIALQSIRPENVLRLDRNELSQKLVDDSLILNYQYGKSKDIIYDYEEIETTLRNMISPLVLIDTDKLRFLNYQFELYGENTSLINDVRARIKQQQLPNDERIKLQRLLSTMNNDDILNYLGSLDYVFTYLRNSISENATETTSIQLFVEHHIHSYTCLNENILRRPPFSAIQLRYIIDLYEMIEETAFDQVLRAYIKKELVEETFTDEERHRVLTGFSRMTFEKDNIADPLKSIDNWISMLKRLMIRVLNANVSLETPLQYYLERTDLWSDRISVTDLDTFTVDDDILLQHTYVILRGLEKKQETNNRSSQQKKTTEIQSAQGQTQKIQTWFDATTKSTTATKVTAAKNKDTKSKLRIVLSQCIMRTRSQSLAIKKEAKDSTNQTMSKNRKKTKRLTIEAHVESIPIEKRLRGYRSTPTNAIRHRIQRAVNERLYLLATSSIPEEPTRREYRVFGQTGNVYTVIITHLLSCTCPDYMNGNVCKHIIFILHRVLKVDRRSRFLYQKALLTTELNEIFTSADAQQNEMFNNSNILAERQ